MKKRLQERFRTEVSGLRAMIGAFLRVDMVDDLSYPANVFLSEIAIFAPVVTSFFIGELTVGSNNSQFFGDDYFTYAVLGLAVTGVLTTSLGGFGYALQRAQERGTLETYLVEPVPWTFLPFAMNLWQTVLGLFNGTLILLIGLALGAQYELSGLPTFLVMVLLGILGCQAVGIVSASLLILMKRSSAVIKLYNLAASLLAGAVFSVDQLPEWLRIVAFTLPHTWAVTVAREALMVDAGSFSVQVRTGVAVLTGFTLVVGGVGLFLFRRSLEYARKMGLLSGY